MKEKILALLKETNQYISGQDLCEHFGVSRTAVWKAINQLKKEGYQIDSVQNKGYRLVAIPDILSEAELKTSRNTRWIGKNLVFFEETDSTNNQAKRIAEDGAESGSLVVADCQSAGRGRRGRNFSSPKGVGIFMTAMIRPEVLPNQASMLTLVSALAVRAAIEEVAGLKTQIKWPNDVIINGKKTCGILTEMSSQEDYINYLVIGIGINVKNPDFPEEIREVATSLSIEGVENISRCELVWSVWRHFENYYDSYLKTRDLSELEEEYNCYLVNRDQKVRVLDYSNPYEGVARGIDKSGNLLVETKEGIQTVSTGEVSVRGVYGYV